MKNTNTTTPARAGSAKRFASKSITVHLTEAQAARIERLASVLNIAPGDLMRTLALGDLDGWGCAEDFISNFGDNRKEFETEASQNTDSIDEAVICWMGCVLGLEPHRLARKRAA